MAGGTPAGPPNTAAPAEGAPRGTLAPLPQRPTLAPLAPTDGGAAPGALLRPAPIPPLASLQTPSPPGAPDSQQQQPLNAPGTTPADARERASLNGLASPAAAPPPPAHAAAGPPPPPGVLPLRDPETSDGGRGGHPEGQSAPLPGAIQTPTAASAPGAAAALAGPPAAVAKGGRPKPPPHDPPQEAIQGQKGDDPSIEEYIPFGFVELRERLLADHLDVFQKADVRRNFIDLCNWMSLRNTLRLEIDYGDAHEKYALLDPDKDTLVFKAKAAAEKAGAGVDSVATTKLVPKGNIREQVDAVYEELDHIFARAEFEELPREDLEKAKNDKSLMGVEVITVSDEYLEYRIHYRGSRTKKIQFRRWGLFKRQIEMNVYERLAVTFRLKKPVNTEDLPEEPAVAGVDTRPWYKRLCGRSVKAGASLHELRDEYLYMKLFKDVLQCDVDMLLPGATVKFTWFDYLMIWAPILFGCGCAIWKAVSGTIDFSTLINAALSVVLIVMPVTWGVRAYMSIKEKQRVHQAHLNALFLLHNLNNNAGVISQLLDEAQEQEDNETMLAYFFLWKGSPKPPPMRKLDLDRAVERYVQTKLDDLGVRIRLDFDVVESIERLERMGLIQTLAGEGHERLLQVLPLGEALVKAHVRHFDETRETGQPDQIRHQTRRTGSVVLRWHECLDVFRPTGQRFRYFWNAETGESSYFEPNEPYIKLSAGPAVDFENAHGIAVADAAKLTGTTASEAAAIAAAKGGKGGSQSAAKHGKVA